MHTQEKEERTIELRRDNWNNLYMKKLFAKPRH